MGVHGLTTYLRENKRALSATLTRSTANDVPIPVIVDGFSFIYELLRISNLPWVYGGEYPEISNLVIKVVEAWVAVGLRVFFVFDGPCPHLKFSTLIYRQGQSHIQPSLLFFRTSASSRSSPRFLNETRIIPPLSYSACLQGLYSLSSRTDRVEIHFADEEGDPYAVELAGRVGGYILGMDSDFVVLNTEGYLGYIPLDEMIWSAPQDEIESVHDDDDGFQTVRKSKGKQKSWVNTSQGRGLIPPETKSLKELTLSLTTYDPSVLASHLNLPVALLPLLGALVGNDFTKESSPSQQRIQQMFFDRQLTLSQRITRVANTIRSILSDSQKRKAKHQLGSVMDLIDRTVHALLTHGPSSLGSGEVDTIVEKIVEATLQYAIPKYDGDTQGHAGLWAGDICALHIPSACPLLPLFSHSITSLAGSSSDNDEDGLDDEILRRDQLRSSYISAYRNGLLAPKVIDILNTGTYWPRLFLENPDLENVGCSIGRPIREWMYSILDNGIGLPERAEEHPDTDEFVDDTEEEEEEEEDDDELIDVVEENDDEGTGENEDLLAPLRGELQRLREPNGDTPPPPSVSHSTHSVSVRTSQPKVVIEYIRRGTRLSPEEVTVFPLSDLLPAWPDLGDDDPSVPVALKSEEARFSVFLHLLGVDHAPIRALSPEQLMPVLALRWVVHTMDKRSWKSGSSREKESERWTKREAQAFISSFTWGGAEALTKDVSEHEYPPLLDRNIQLAAQTLSALESIHHFAQVLFLSNRVPTPVALFSGKLFHLFLTGAAVPRPLSAALWEACTFGLEDAFGEARKKKKKINAPISSRATNSHAAGIRNGMSGRYGMLVDIADSN